MGEKPTNATIIHSVYYLCMVAPTCFGITLHPQGAFLVPSERCSIEEIGRVVSCDVVRAHVTRHNTHIHNIPSTAPQLIISQKTLGTLPDDGNVMPKHVGATIHN
jgi:hypothetical protein